jgi:hypothetical protein
MHAAAEDLVDVAHREGHVVEAGLACGSCSRNRSWWPPRRAAQEGAAPGIAVRLHEAEVLHIEALAGLHVLDEEHHVADLDGLARS